MSKETSSYNSKVSKSQTVRIVYDDTGYVIVRYGNRYAATATENSTASGSSGAPESYISVVSRKNITDSARWNLYKYTGADKAGAVFIAPDDFTNIGAVVGKTYNIKVPIWYTMPRINSNVINTGLNKKDMCTIEWDNERYIAKVIPNYSGVMEINDLIWVADNGTPVTYYNKTYCYNTVFDENEYYIQNSYTKKSIHILGPSNEEGTVLHLWDYYDVSHARWKVEHVSGSPGYVRLKSVYSVFYIGVAPDDKGVIIQTSVKGDNTLWRISVVDNQTTYDIVCKLYEDENMFLTSPKADIGNGEWVTQRNNHTELVKWSFFDTSMYLGELEYWNGTEIISETSGAYSNIPKIYVDDEAMSNNNFKNAFNRALLQWEYVLGVNFEIVNLKSIADITVSLNYKDLSDIQISYGNTAWRSKIEGYCSYNHRLVYLLRIQYSDVIISYSDSVSQEVLNVTLVHELGHALGYCCHSPNVGEVMYWSQTTTDDNLSLSEQRHLQEIWRVLNIIK